MKVYIEKEVEEFYYIKVRYGDLYKWGSQKTFVRIPYKKKNGKWGSKYYCSARETAIFFDTPVKAYELTRKYKADYQITAFKVPVPSLFKEIEVEGIKCYILKEMGVDL